MVCLQGGINYNHSYDCEGLAMNKKYETLPAKKRAFMYATEDMDYQTSLPVTPQPSDSESEELAEYPSKKHCPETSDHDLARVSV